MNKKLQKGLLIAICIAVPILIIGGIIGMIYLGWYNSDATIFATAMQSQSADSPNELSLNGEMKIAEEGIDGTFSATVLAGDNLLRLDLSAKGTFPEEVNATVSAIWADNGVYLKSDPIGLLADTDEELAKLSGMGLGDWIFIDTEYFYELLGGGTYDISGLSTCLEKTVENTDIAALNKDLYDLLYTDGIFYVETKERNKDTIVYDLSYSTRPIDYADLLQRAYEIDFVKEATGCILDTIGMGWLSDMMVDAAINQIYEYSVSEDGINTIATLEYINQESTVTVDIDSREIVDLVSGIYFNELGALIDIDMTMRKQDRQIELPTSYQNLRDLLN